MLSSHQLVLKSIACGSASRGDTQLAVDGAQVRMNGVQTQHQLLGDLSVGHFLRQQAQYLYFTGARSSG
jgi:hypothetical protein